MDTPTPTPANTTHPGINTIVTDNSPVIFYDSAAMSASGSDSQSLSLTPHPFLPTEMLIKYGLNPDDCCPTCHQGVANTWMEIEIDGKSYRVCCAQVFALRQALKRMGRPVTHIVTMPHKT